MSGRDRVLIERRDVIALERLTSAAVANIEALEQAGYAIGRTTYSDMVRLNANLLKALGNDPAPPLATVNSTPRESQPNEPHASTNGNSAPRRVSQTDESRSLR